MNRPRNSGILDLYTEYLKLSGRVDGGKLFEECEELVRDIKEVLYIDKDQRYTDQIDSFMKGIKNLYLIKLNPNDYKKYNKMKEKFSINDVIIHIRKYNKNSISEEEKEYLSKWTK